MNTQSPNRPAADERDLRFFPVDNPSPQRLKPEQIQHFNERGYIFPLDVFDDAEAKRNRAYFDRLLEEAKAANHGQGAYAINGFHTHCRGLWDLANDPRIVGYVADLLGPNIVCWGSHYFCKLPHDPKSVPWHQDASYWPLTPSKTVTVWLAIDDADAENSAMQYIPATHNRGHLAWAKTSKDAVLDQEVVGVDELGEPVYVQLKAGQVSMHADMLVHGSEPNRSGRRRCGLTLRYASTDVRSTSGWHGNSIWVRGSDPANHWANNPRPEGDQIDPQTWARRKGKPIGGN